MNEMILPCLVLWVSGEIQWDKVNIYMCICSRTAFLKDNQYFKLFLSGHLNLKCTANTQKILKTTSKIACPLGVKKQQGYFWKKKKKKLCCSGNVLTVRILQVLNPHSLLLPSINITKLLFSYITAILIIILFKSKCIWAPTKLILIRKVKRRLALGRHTGLGFRWPSVSPYLCSRSLAILFQLLPKATHAGIVP